MACENSSRSSGLEAPDCPLGSGDRHPMRRTERSARNCPSNAGIIPLGRVLDRRLSGTTKQPLTAEVLAIASSRRAEYVAWSAGGGEGGDAAEEQFSVP